MAGRQCLPRCTRRGLAAEDRALRVLLDWRNDDKPEEERAALARMSERSWRRYKREIWPLALAMRRAHYAEHLLVLDAAMVKFALRGSYKHLALAYERIEGFVPGASTPPTTGEAGADAWDLVGDEVRRRIVEAMHNPMAAAEALQSPLTAQRTPLD